VTGASTGAAGVAAAKGAGALVAATGAGLGVTVFAVVAGAGAAARGAGALVAAPGVVVEVSGFAVAAGAAVGAGATSDPEAGATPVRGSGRAPAELATKDPVAPPRMGSMTGIARER